MSFSASQVLGIPIGLYLANSMGWHSPFWMIAGFGLVIGVFIVIYLKPINEHLKLQHDRNAFQHLFHTVSKPRYLFGFLAMSLLATGGFMLMPFGSTFGTQNIGLTMAQLPMLYMITGIFSIASGPLAGRLSDKLGKMKMFTIGSLAAIVVIAIYTNMGTSPFWLACLISVLLFMAVTARMIPASALMTAIPSPADRGAFMSVNSATMQISGGISSVIAGMIVWQAPDGKLHNYDVLGYVVAGSMLVMIVMMHYISRMIASQPAPGQHAMPVAAAREIAAVPTEM
jgi:predicted MFS family arabinose efflux permease